MEFSIRDIKGIGPRKEALFARLHLTTVTDLLQYFPRDYEDRSHVWPIGQVPDVDARPIQQTLAPTRRARLCRVSHSFSRAGCQTTIG